MSEPMHDPSAHFEALVDHLGRFDQPRRQHLDQMYGVGSAEPADIARWWCQQPECVVEVVDHKICDPDLRLAVDQLVREHDLPVDLELLDPAVRNTMAELGLLGAGCCDESDESDESDEQGRWASVPGALAAILAPTLSGMRPTLLVVLGRRPAQEVVALAGRYGIGTEGSTIEVILRISEAFGGAEFMGEILGRLANPDWIGAAMMTFELGGVCYWREIFGHDLSDGADQDHANVVPLMRNDERDEQRQIADRLVELGVLFKLDANDSDYELVALPEELWFGLWTVGQEWLFEWTAMSFEELNAAAIGRSASRPAASNIRPALKWLACEADHGRLRGQHQPADDTIASLDRRSEGVSVHWKAVADIGRDMGVVEPDSWQGQAQGRWRVGPFAEFLLGEPRKDIAWETLSAWINGRVGTGVDRAMGRAVGLDEQWRQHLVELFDDRDGPLAPWMSYPGVDHVETGSGCLRELAAGDQDLMLLELGLTNTCLCLAKVHWLDLLSVLDADQWYPRGQLATLLQWTSAYALFSQIGHIVQDPHSNYYFPLQRPSFLSFPAHADAFEDWCDDIIANLLAPLGCADVSPDGSRVRLQPTSLRVESPDDWPEDPRLDVLRSVLDDPDFEMGPLDQRPNPLRPVAEASGPHQVDLQRPLRDVLLACEGRGIETFDGHVLQLGADT